MDSSKVQTALEPLVPFAIASVSDVSDVAERGERSITGQLGHCFPDK